VANASIVAWRSYPTADFDHLLAYRHRALVQAGIGQRGGQVALRSPALVGARRFEELLAERDRALVQAG